MDKEKILIVDDEPKLVRLVREVLTATGYSVIAANRGATAIKMTAMEQPNLIILDIVLADEIDGYQVARSVREFSEVPIIMLTAKVRESELLKGFESGADDYLKKPFSSKELLARVQAILKRNRAGVGTQDDAEITCGGLAIMPAQRNVQLHGQDVHLTRTEFNLLMVLAKNKNKVVLHENILETVWGSEYRNDLEYLRAYIRYLRKKLEDDPANPKIIITTQGVGYMLACTDGDT